MMNPTFAVWDEIKAYAKTYAASDRPLPIDPGCEKLLQEMIERKIPEVHLRDKAFEFYAGELCKMITDLREQQVS